MPTEHDIDHKISQMNINEVDPVQLQVSTGLPAAIASLRPPDGRAVANDLNAPIPTGSTKGFHPHLNLLCMVSGSTETGIAQLRLPICIVIIDFLCPSCTERATQMPKSSKPVLQSGTSKGYL